MNTLHLLRKLYVFSFIALNTTFMWASEIDSLKTVLAEVPDGEQKARVLGKLSLIYRDYKIDSAVYYINEALDLTKKMQNDTLIHAAYINKGVIEMNMGEYDKSKQTFLKAREMAASLGLEDNVNKVDANLGIVFYYESKLDSTIYYFTKVTEYFEKKGDRKSLKNMYMNLGQINSTKGYHINSIEYALKSMEIAEEYNEQRDVAALYNNIAISYRRIDQPQQAIDYSKKGLDIALAQKDNRTVSKCYSAIGLSLINLEKYEEALNSFKKGLALCLELKNKKSTAIAYSNIGEVHQHLLQYDSAMVYAQKALVLQDSISDKRSMAISCSNIGVIHMKQNDFNKAKVSLRKAEQLAEEVKSEEVLHLVYENLSDLQKGKGNYKSAYDYFKKHQIIKDSLFNEKKINRLKEIQELYSTAKDSINQVKYQLNLANKDKEIAKRNNLLTLAGFGILLLFIAAFFQYFRKQKERNEKELLEVNNKLLEEKKLELEHNNAELKVKIGETSEALKTPQFYAQQQITLSNRDKSTFLLGEISHIKSTGGALRFTVFNTDTRQKEEIWDWSKSLKALQEDLPDALFVQVHRSYLVNRLKIQSLKRDVLTLSGNEQVKIGRKYEEKVKSMMKN